MLISNSTEFKYFDCFDSEVTTLDPKKFYKSQFTSLTQWDQVFEKGMEITVC